MRLFHVVSVVVSVASALITNPMSAARVLASEPSIAAHRLSGTARALDGDTLDLSTDRGVVRIRLQGIDAAEGGQRCNMRWIGTWDCGRAATIALEQLVAGNSVVCDTEGVDKYGRTLGVCHAAGRTINGDLVREGLAWAFVQYSTRFAAEEAEARHARRGIWQAATQTPWDWRAAQRGQQPASLHETTRPRAPTGQQQRAEAAPANCDIKGNVTRNGERIYHTASSPWYERVRMSLGMGRRWFCSETEARAAGWRPAGALASAN
jgi:endonuclease YncB( thermonuclease family)